MSSLWPWVAVAGAGVLHGLNPGTGWMLAAACGLRSGDARSALHALVPIAAGHVASVGAVAAAVALGHALEDGLRPAMGALLVLALVLVWHGQRRRGPCGTAPAPLEASGHVGLALWSFVASTAHGSGMMLVPALVPLCLGDAPAGEITASGSLMLALAAVAVHALAMIGTLGMIAVGTVRGCVRLRRGGSGRPPGGADGRRAGPGHA